MRLIVLALAFVVSGCAPEFVTAASLDDARATRMAVRGDASRFAFGTYSIRNVRRGMTIAMSMSSGSTDEPASLGAHSTVGSRRQSISFVLGRGARETWRVRCEKARPVLDAEGRAGPMTLDCEVHTVTPPALALHLEDGAGSVVSGEPFEIEEQRAMGMVTGYHLLDANGALAALDLTQTPPRVLSAARNPTLPVAFTLASLIAAAPND